MQEVLANAVSVIDGRAVTTSLKIAEVFGKEHKDVLRTIREMGLPENFSQRNFAPAEYLDAQDKKRPMYQVTRDGFTLLAMGFTGKKAMEFKIAYIEAFNSMENQLRGKAAVRKRRDLRGKRMRFSDAVEMLNRATFRLQRLSSILLGDALFSVPSCPDEVADFCRFAGLSNVNPVRFFNYYEARRWRIDGHPIDSWQTVCRSWDQRAFEIQSM